MLVMEGRVNNGAAERPVSGVIQAPFAIPYDAMLPALVEVSNLIVSVALSATHVRYNAVRMEPTWMLIGHAAGVAAAMVVSASPQPVVPPMPLPLLPGC